VRRGNRFVLTSGFLNYRKYDQGACEGREAHRAAIPIPIKKSRWVTRRKGGTSRGQKSGGAITKDR